MIADKSRRDIFVWAMSAVRTIVLGILTALVANAAHLPTGHVVHSGTEISPVDRTSVPRVAQPTKEMRDPFASMLLG
jgi:hypothetical protein